MKRKTTLFAAAGLALILLCLSSFQQTHEKYLIVRTIEAMSGSGVDSKIIIVNEAGEAEEIEIGKMNDKHFPDNVKKINAVFNKLTDKGYHLISSMGCGANMLAGTYIFEKK